MHDLVVAQRANKVLGKGVHDGEREQAVVAGAPRKIGLHVVQGVVHPAHVPLVVEAQAAVLRRIGHERPRGGLLGDHQHAWVRLEGHGQCFIRPVGQTIDEGEIIWTQK